MQPTQTPERETPAQHAERLRDELQRLEQLLAANGLLPPAAIAALGAVRSSAEALTESLLVDPVDGRTSEAQFRAAFDSSSIGMCQADPETGKLLRVNRRYCEMTGYAQEELVGRPFLELSFPADRTDRGGLPQLLSGDTREFRVEKRLVRKDGSLIWVIVVANLVRDEEGHPQVTVALVQDITERKNAEEALRRSEERYRLATDAMNGVVYEFDYATRSLRLSEGVHRMFGYRRTEVPQSSDWWLQLIHPSDLDEVRYARDQAIARRAPSIDREYRVRHRDGRWIWVRDHASIVYGPEPEGAVRVVGLVVSIDEERRFQDSLMAADDKKNQFLATLAHELRNPLAPVRNAVSILNIIGVPGAHGQAAVDMIERQVTHLSLLVDDLLDVSRITHGKIQLRRERLDLRVLAEEALSVSEPLLKAAGHSITVRQPAEAVFVDADRLRLVQVICNLLNNAGRYTARGGDIVVEVSTEEGDASLCVCDNGVGMVPELIDEIFEPFMQIGDGGSRQGGLGIGLWLVRSLVQMHGGSVQADSEGPGKGSRVGFKLPLAREHGPREASVAHNAAGVPPQRLLVIDDNADAADSQATLLRMLGHEVRVAYDGPSGIAAAAEFKPRTVLLDLGMPGLSGYEVARRLRAIPGLDKVLLIAQTGWGQEEDRRRTALAGFDAHLTKPADMRELMEVLRANQNR